eukprot:COSAG01_NODE_6025_length_3894_cov_71.310408_3_plen_92_part_00
MQPLVTCQKRQNARNLLVEKFFSRIENLLQGFCHTGMGFYIFYSKFGRFSIILYIVATTYDTDSVHSVPIVGSWGHGKHGSAGGGRPGGVR